MTTNSKILLGILGAAAAGVVVGLLIAPQKGSDTRQQVKRTTGTWVNHLGQLFTRGKQQLNEAKEKVRIGKAAAEERVQRLKNTIS